jgi:anti-sigma factor RsiW
MNCHGARKRIPLYVGGELAPKKSEHVRRHLEACPACRTEAEEIGRARLAVREMARSAQAEDWSPAEWRRLVADVTGTASDDRRGGPAEWKLRPVLAGALGSLILVLLTGILFLFRSSNSPEAPVMAMSTIDESAKVEAAPKANPDVTSVNLVSPETGTKIIWFYNKKFEWQGFGK